MSFVAKLKLSDSNQSGGISVLNFSMNLNQSIDQQNRPDAAVEGGIIHLSIESSNDNAMLEWMMSPSMMKNGTITFSRRDNASSMRTVKFTDTFCVNYTERFDANSERPMSIDLTLSARILDFGGSLTITNNWPGTYSDAASDSSSTTSISEDEPTTTTLEPEPEMPETPTAIESPVEMKPPATIENPEVTNTIGEDLDAGIAEAEATTDDVQTEIEQKKEEIKAKKEELKEEAKNTAEEYIPGSKEVLNEAEAEVKAAKEAAKEALMEGLPDVLNDVPNPSDLFE